MLQTALALRLHTNVQTGQNNLQSAKSVAQLTSALSELAKQFWEKRG
ncbi:Aerotaxis sensor receptor protein [Escherichia coli CE418]|nr:Aerotaxis sensor receptor protein [Escherichia coli CE418]